MPNQLVCRPRRTLPVGLLQVTGVLDRITGDALGRAVDRSLSAQPEALLIDVDGMRMADATGLSLLGPAVAQSAGWVGVPVVLCGSGATELLRGHPGITAAASSAEALDRAAGLPRPSRIRARLRPVPDACRQVRQLVTQACTAWQHRDVAATAALIATELVANVVRHAHTTMVVTMGLRDGLFCLTVRDGSRTLPTEANPGNRQAGGRGLQLVRELTDAWGVLPVLDGKIVWTRLAG
jgi:hypothetical protein